MRMSGMTCWMVVVTVLSVSTAGCFDFEKYARVRLPNGDDGYVARCPGLLGCYQQATMMCQKHGYRQYKVVEAHQADIPGFAVGAGNTAIAQGASSGHEMVYVCIEPTDADAPAQFPEPTRRTVR